MRRGDTTAAIVCLLMGAGHLAARVSSPSEPELRAGVAAVFHGKGVLAMSGPLLPLGTKLSLVTVDLPQERRTARVVRVVSDDKDMHDRIPGPYYEIASTEEGRELPQLAVAVLDAPTASTIGTALSLRVSATLPDIRVRSCASYEGLHLTLWSGEPLRSRREWHVYYYLGYDTQLTCQPADTRDDG